MTPAYYKGQDINYPQALVRSVASYLKVDTISFAEIYLSPLTIISPIGAAKSLL